MSAESIYEHLSYLDQAVNHLEDLLYQKEAEISDLTVRLANAEMATLSARKEQEDLAVRIQREAQRHIENEVCARVEATLVAERLAMKEEIEKARQQVQEAKAAAALPKKSKEPQADLFSQSWATPKPAARVANDQSALILAGKLDSTIDKVQRLLREAGA